MDGRDLEGRYPAGVVLVDKPEMRVWLYDWDSEAEEFNVREPEGRPLDREGQWDAADSSDWEVRAAPWVGDPSW